MAFLGALSLGCTILALHERRGSIRVHYESDFAKSEISDSNRYRHGSVQKNDACAGEEACGKRDLIRQ